MTENTKPKSTRRTRNKDIPTTDTVPDVEPVEEPVDVTEPETNPEESTEVVGAIDLADVVAASGNTHTYDDVPAVTITGAGAENYSSETNLFALKSVSKTPILVNNNRPFVDVPTGLNVTIADGYVGFILPHSDVLGKDLSVKGSPVVLLGDNPSLNVTLHNIGIGKRSVEEGDHIATLLVLPKYHVDVKTSN